MLHFLLVSLFHVVIIVIDELIDTYHGKSPCHVYIPSKPHPNGHLIHEAVSISRNHSLPFLYSMLPYFGGARAGTLAVVDTLLDGANNCHVFMDSWFPSKGKFYIIVVFNM